MTGPRATTVNMIRTILWQVLIDFLPTVKAATLMFISGHGSAISSAKQGKPVSIELISCLGRANGHAFHENINRIHTELSFINP